MLSRRTFVAGALVPVVAGCAGGLWSGSNAKALSPIEPGKGRVFIYRVSSMGSTFTPEVLLNGASVGKPVRPGLLYRDVPPGSYAVTTSLTSRVVHFSIAAGEKRYVRLGSGFFESNLHPELVDPPRGEAEVSGLEILPQTRK